MMPTKNDQLMIPSLPPSTKMINRSIISKEWNLQTRGKFQEPLTPLLCGRHKCMFPFWFFKVWSVTCLNAYEILNFMEIQSSYFLLSYQRNKAYIYHYISYFLNTFLVSLGQYINHHICLLFVTKFCF